MNNWLYLALLAPAVYTVVNFVDKYVVEHKVKDYRGMPIYGSIVGLVVGTLFWIAVGFPFLPLFDAVLVISTGVLTLFGYALYFNALSKSQTSYVIGLFQLIPLITLALSFIFLSERINGSQFVGFLMVLLTVLSLSINKEKKKFKFDSAFYLVLISDVFFAFANIILKFAITADSFTKIFSYESWGIALGGLILWLVFPTVRKAFLKTTKTVGTKVLGIMFLNEFIFIISKVITFLAIALGPVALVSVLGGTQVFYGILYGFILTIVAPKIFHEDISKGGLTKKIILMSLMFAGIWLIH